MNIKKYFPKRNLNDLSKNEIIVLISLAFTSWGAEHFDFEVLGPEGNIMKNMDPYFEEFLESVCDQKIFGNSIYPGYLLTCEKLNKQWR